MANKNSMLVRKTAKLTYDFSVDGATTSAVSMTPSQSDLIPIGATVVGVVIDVTTGVAGPTTVLVTGGGVTLVGSQTIINNQFDTAGVFRIDRAGNSGTSSTAGYIPIKATSTAALAVTFTTSVTSAGKFSLYVDYLL